MANKYQNKDEYVKPRSISLTSSDHKRFKIHSKKQGLTFSEMIRVLFDEDIEDEKKAIARQQVMTRSQKKADRILKIKNKE